MRTRLAEKGGLNLLITAILGLTPIAGSAFWGPMSFAMMGGLLIATALTLIFLPALYAVWYRIAPKQ